MSTRKERSASKEQYWRSQVRQWRKSGLAVRAFCEEQGLSEPNFYAWRRTLAQRDAAVQFVPVRVTREFSSNVTADGTAPPSAPAWGDGVAGVIELVLSGGRRLRIAPGFDGPTLRRVLALLENGREPSQAEGAEGRP